MTMDSGDTPDSEAALRRGVLTGDAQAWQALYEGAFDQFYAYVFFRAGRDHARAEDLVQECWMIAVRRIADFDPARGTFAGWLRGIADNVMRNDRRRAARLCAEQATELDAAEPTARSGTSEHDGQRELAELIGLTLSGLPVHYREVLAAKYEDRMTLAEIAAQRGQTRRAIDSLLTRAKAAFREAFARLKGNGD